MACIKVAMWVASQTSPGTLKPIKLIANAIILNFFIVIKGLTERFNGSQGFSSPHSGNAARHL